MKNSATNRRYAFYCETKVTKRIEREEIERLMEKFGEHKVRKVSARWVGYERVKTNDHKTYWREKK